MEEIKNEEVKNYTDAEAATVGTLAITGVMLALMGTTYGIGKFSGGRKVKKQNKLYNKGFKQGLKMANDLVEATMNS